MGERCGCVSVNTRASREVPVACHSFDIVKSNTKMALPPGPKTTQRCSRGTLSIKAMLRGRALALASS